MTDPTKPNESTRTYVSLVLFIHLFCVAVVLSSNHFPSRLQSKLTKTLAIYTKTLHLDPGVTRFELTDGESGLMQLHQWEVVELAKPNDVEGKVVLRIPSSQGRAGFQHSRGEMYSRLAAFYASTENVDDNACATMARDLAAHYFASRKQRTQATSTRDVSTNDTINRRLLIRCVSLADQEHSPVYEVDAWRTDNGGLQILKRMEASRTAPANY